MSRPTQVHIDQEALLHNLARVKELAPSQGVIAMVKADAYGCGLAKVAPVLAKGIYAFGVAYLDEALSLRALGLETKCLIFQGVFNHEELETAVKFKLEPVIHQREQLSQLLQSPLAKKIKVWVKINTGMNRLGFLPEEVDSVLQALDACPWVDEELGLLTHLASADEPTNSCNQEQLEIFWGLKLPEVKLIKSIANSAAIFSLPQSHAEVVRPGIMLYGVSPFANTIGKELGLRPVMHFNSCITAIHHYPYPVGIGYGGQFRTQKSSVIAVVGAGYGDGYPRHIADNTPVWLEGQQAMIVGRISMDNLTIDISECQGIRLGSKVELWGKSIAVERIALAANTSPYELLCQVKPRLCPVLMKSG